MRRFQETDCKFQQTSLKLDKVARNIANLGPRLGGFVEEALKSAAVKLFRERQLDVHEIHYVELRGMICSTQNFIAQKLRRFICA